MREVRTGMPIMLAGRLSSTFMLCDRPPGGKQVQAAVTAERRLGAFFYDNRKAHARKEKVAMARR